MKLPGGAASGGRWGSAGGDGPRLGPKASSKSANKKTARLRTPRPVPPTAERREGLGPLRRSVNLTTVPVYAFASTPKLTGEGSPDGDAGSVPTRTRT